MTKELVEYWRRLDGSVHPDDALVFSQERDQGFNLDYPPPAFIGDVANAPVILLDNNGGYDAHMTPGEFPHPASHDEFREMLRAPRPVDPTARSMSR